jgi:Cu(I)/Ag(I) efflux system periplasmic protein CusF
MKKQYVLVASIALLVTTYLGIFSAHATDGTHQLSTQNSGMADGEVRKLDLDNSKITLKHGVIKSLDMPPMTMVFNIKDKASFEKMKVGDKIKFLAVNENGKMMITKIEAAQ